MFKKSFSILQVLFPFFRRGTKIPRILSTIVALCVIIPVSFVVIGLIFGLLSSSFVLHRDVRFAQGSVSVLYRYQIEELALVREYELYRDKNSLTKFARTVAEFPGFSAKLRRQLTSLDLGSALSVVHDLVQKNRQWQVMYEPVLSGKRRHLSVSEDRQGLRSVLSVRNDYLLLSLMLNSKATQSDADTVKRFTDVVTLCIYFLGITIFSVLLLARRQGLLESDLRLQRRTVDAFQLAALPQVLPDVPGIEFDSVYVPAKAEFRIGGDWYDAQRLADGRVIVSIGDVAGFGLEASVTMAAVRQSIRAAAEMNPQPLMILDAADRTLKAQQPDRIVTAVVCVYDPVNESFEYASAGHPPPIMRLPDGTVSELDGVGLPLGLRRKDDDVLHRVGFPSGSCVVFYTDGLTESRRDVIAGMAELSELVKNPMVMNSATPAKVIYKIMLPSGTADDVAVLTLRSKDDIERRMQHWVIDSTDASAAAGVRREVVEELRRNGVCQEDLFSAELVFGEMIGNVFRYAPGPVEIVLDRTCQMPVLHFLDTGPGFAVNPRLPSDDLSERGRGLFLVWSLTHEFTVTRRDSAGSHARAVLLSRPVPRPRKGSTPLPV